MNIADVYHKQFARRSWSHVYESLPSMQGMTVLDLGCGPGDQAAEFVARGAWAIGVDINDELLVAARAKGGAKRMFIKADIRQPFELGMKVDGIWAGFTAAYFTDLASALAQWKVHLRPGGWITLIEIDDFFGHEPLEPETVSLLRGYAHESLTAGRYDFHMGRKLRGHLEAAGFVIVATSALPDEEFSFTGPASPEIIEAWRTRFGVMQLLRSYCSERFDQVERDFLECLKSPSHSCCASVQCCIAKLPGGTN